MSRPITIADDDILQAARTVLGERGLRATTAEVAERAGISEGIIFKRYGNKAQLFRAAMSTTHHVDDLLDRLLGLGLLATENDFERLVASTLQTLRMVVPMVMMSWTQSRGTDAHALPDELQSERPSPLRALIATTKFFERQIQNGVLQKRNPEIVARVLIGSVWHFAFMETVLDKRNTDLSGEEFAKELGRMLHQDLALPSAGAKGHSPKLHKKARKKAEKAAKKAHKKGGDR